MIVLLGVLVVVVGFALRFNPLLVVTVAGITSALLGGLSPLHVLGLSALLVEWMGVHPAPLFAIAMLSGFCGTLCTPMAANFNLVPPALLEMRDKDAQIKVQIPTAAALLSVNVAFMLIFPFR
ncbi:MAG: DUF979 family protein [Candidatus Cybelea sp.]